MDIRFVLVVFAAILLFVGCTSEQNTSSINNSPNISAQPTENKSQSGVPFIFNSLDTFRLNDSIPAGYFLFMDAWSTPENIKKSLNADYLGVGMPLFIRTDMYAGKRQYLFSSAPDIMAFKNEMKKNGITQDPNSSVLDEIGRAPNGWGVNMILDKTGYTSVRENGSLKMYLTNGNRSGFVEKMTLYPAENASKIMQKDTDYLHRLGASGNWSVSEIKELQSPINAIVYLIEAKSPGQSAAFYVDYAIGNVLVSIIVSTDPYNPNPSDKELAISVAQLVANKVAN